MAKLEPFCLFAFSPCFIKMAAKYYIAKEGNNTFSLNYMIFISSYSFDMQKKKSSYVYQCPEAENASVYCEIKVILCRYNLCFKIYGRKNNFLAFYRRKIFALLYQQKMNGCLMFLTFNYFHIQQTFSVPNCI